MATMGERVIVELPREVAQWLLFFVERLPARRTSEEDERRGALVEARLSEALDSDA